MSKSDTYIAGVDLGGTKIATALLTTEGHIVERKRLDTLAEEGPDAVIERIAQSVKDVQKGHPILGVGVGTPGPLDSEKGVVLHGPNLAGWTNVPLRDRLQNLLQTEVKVENDANAAAWGEYVFGAGKGTKNMVYITISTGIGSGLVLNGELFVGSNSFAGELGHTMIDPAGPRCGCGNVGCWEACASGTAIGRYARESAQAGQTKMAELAAEEGVPVSAKHVFAAAQLGDTAAQAIVDKTVHYLGIGLANTVHSYNPERIVIGGGVSNVGDFLFDALREKTDSLVMPPYRKTYEIVPAQLGDDVGILGAAALFLGKTSGTGVR